MCKNSYRCVGAFTLKLMSAYVTSRVYLELMLNERQTKVSSCLCNGEEGSIHTLLCHIFLSFVVT